MSASTTKALQTRWAQGKHASPRNASADCGTQPGASPLMQVGANLLDRVEERLASMAQAVKR
jgi:hypothetical protein